MDENNVIVQGLGFEISEDKSNPDYLNGRFCICDFDVNKNNVSLNRDTIDEWVSTLVGTPLVAKITKDIRGKQDFGSHEMRIVATKDKNGKVHKKAVFDTSAFGVCTSVSIDTAEDGNDYIYADYKIWKRFENACKIVKERAENLHTSWEICTEEFTQKIKDGKAIKQIDKGRFIGLAMLSKNTPPAYDSSGLLEVASKQEDELNIALMEDLENLNISSNINITEKEVTEMDKNKIEVNTVQTSEEIVDNVETSENVENIETEQTEQTVVEQSEESNTTETIAEANVDNNTDDNVETSALTDNDIRHKLEREFDKLVDDNGHRYCGWCFMMFPADNMAWFKEYSRDTETDLIEVIYTVENDNVVITETNQVSLTVSPRVINQTIAQKDSAIAEMSSQIKSLTDEISALKPYKDKVEEIEKAEKEAELEQNRKELSEYAISSGYITVEEVETSEEIKAMINDLNKVGIQSIISDRVVSQLNSNKSNVEISQDNSNEQDNISINLSAIDVDTNDNKGVNTKEARDAVRRYIGRK
jgi:hypothetical protein